MPRLLSFEAGVSSHAPDLTAAIKAALTVDGDLPVMPTTSSALTHPSF